MLLLQISSPFVVELKSHIFLTNENSKFLWTFFRLILLFFIVLTKQFTQLIETIFFHSLFNLSSLSSMHWRHHEPKISKKKQNYEKLLRQVFIFYFGLFLHFNALLLDTEKKITWNCRESLNLIYVMQRVIRTW